LIERSVKDKEFFNYSNIFEKNNQPVPAFYTMVILK